MAESELEEWVSELAEVLGVDPGEVDVNALLDVARDAAHGVTRPAAPLATYLVGYAVASGVPVDQANATASALASGWVARDAHAPEQK